MDRSTPDATIQTLVNARYAGDLLTVLACYEVDATVVLEPGKTASGLDAVKDFTEATIALPITFLQRTIIASSKLALHISEWTIKPTDKAGSVPVITGRTADVLRRQTDGTWLLAIDNAWGVDVLPKS